MPIPPTRADRLAVHQRPVHRPLPRAARAEHQAHQGVQAAVGGGRLLARRRQPPDAHARVWDRVLLRQGPGRRTWSGSSAPAPTTTAGSGRSSGCSASRTLAPGLGVLVPGRERRCSTRSSRSAARWGSPRGYTEVKTPQLYDSSLWKTSGHWDKYRENMFVTESSRAADGAQADELPRATASCTRCARTPTGTCRCATPSRACCTATSRRARCTGCCARAASPRTTRTSSAPRTSSRTRLPRCWSSPSPPTRCSASTCASSSRPAPSSGSAPTSCGTAARQALRKALEGQGLAYDLNAGDGAFYGPKIDMHMTDSLGRSWQLGTVPAGLQHARALRPDLHRAPTTPSTAR